MLASLNATLLEYAVVEVTLVSELTEVSELTDALDLVGMLSDRCSI
jgi:hypothetical protein